jgi:hypothetical protein
LLSPQFEGISSYLPERKAAQRVPAYKPKLRSG